MSNDLDEAKHRLLDKLGPNYGVYIQLLGKWFRGMISKKEFDKSAKHLIEQNFILEHNKFWLAFYHHCANSASTPIHNYNLNSNETIGSNGDINHKGSISGGGGGGGSKLQDPTKVFLNDIPKVRCLPSKVITHMKIFVIAWEMGLDSANDQVSVYINLALQQFLKNIITELVCTKTAYRLRENRFRYAMGVKAINPYLNNSLRVFTSNLEHDPYQIESNKMNSSLLDTCMYNDTLFPSRLYEAQALYEYACSTTSVSQPLAKRAKRLKLSEIFINQEDDYNNHQIEFSQNDGQECETNGDLKTSPIDIKNRKKLTLFHLLIAFLTNRAIIPSQSLYSINLERIFTKLTC